MVWPCSKFSASGMTLTSRYPYSALTQQGQCTGPKSEVRIHDVYNEQFIGDAPPGCIRTSAVATLGEARALVAKGVTSARHLVLRHRSIEFLLCSVVRSK